MVLPLLNFSDKRLNKYEVGGDSSDFFIEKGEDEVGEDEVGEGQK